MMGATRDAGPIALAATAIAVLATGCGTVPTAPKGEAPVVQQVPGTVVALRPLVRSQLEGIVERGPVDGAVTVGSARGRLRLPVTPPTGLVVGERVRVHVAAQPVALRADDPDDGSPSTPAALPAAAVARPRTFSTAIGSVRGVTADGILTVDSPLGTATVWVPSPEIFNVGALAQVWTWIEPME